MAFFSLNWNDWGKHTLAVKVIQLTDWKVCSHIVKFNSVFVKFLRVCSVRNTLIQTCWQPFIPEQWAPATLARTRGIKDVLKQNTPHGYIKIDITRSFG